MADTVIPEFLDDMDAMSVITSTVSDALALEEASAVKLLKIFKDSRRELLDRLMSAKITEFQAHHVRGVLAQVESVVRALTRDMEGSLDGDAQDMAENGASDTILQLQALEEKFRGGVIKVNVNEVVVASETKNLLMNRYDSSVDTYGRDLINRMQNRIVQGVAEKKFYHEIVQEIAGYGGIFDGEAYRVQRIVRTELHNVYDTTKLRSLQALQESDVPDLMKMSFDPLDHRTGEDSKLVAGQIQPIDEPFTYRLNGKVYEFMNHPNRPNDRGMTMPYREGWERQDQSLVSDMYPED